jgi:hypothetical protein
MSTTNTTRRGLLASVPAIAVAVAPAGAAVVGGLPAQLDDDPIHAAIEAHREAFTAFNMALGIFGRVEFSGDEDSIGEAQDDVDVMCDVEMDALDALVETVPSTSAGLCIMIDYVVGHYTGEIISGRRHELLRCDNDMLVDVLTTIRDSVAALTEGVRS